MMQFVFRRKRRAALSAVIFTTFLSTMVWAASPPPPPDGPPAPVLASIAISGPLSVDEQSSAQYVCIATYSDGTTASVSASWAVGSTFADLDSTGLLTTGNVENDENLVLTASYGGKSSSYTVTIKYVAPVLSSIAITGPSSIDEETSAQYSCTANWSDGTTMIVTPAWSENSPYATINSGGLLSAGNVTASQSVIITASYNGMTASSSVSILYVAPTLNSITITGPSSLDEETSAQYSCTANWSDETTTTVTPTWSENSVYATINSGGLLSAGNVTTNQSVTITASYNGKSASRLVAIRYVAPTLDSITIAGPLSIDEETSAQYSCTANWSDETITTVTPAWSENSVYATIDASGLLSAGNVTTNQSVTISAGYNGKTASYTVSIKYVAPTLDSITIAGPLSIDEETSAQYSCTANWSDETTTTVTPTWSENSAYATIDAAGLLSAGNVASDKNVTITASYGGKSDTHLVTINYVEPPVYVTGIGISGPSEMEENSATNFICTASYSDGTVKEVSASWSENANFATISTAGTLNVGNIEADSSMTVTASFEGHIATQTVTVWVVKTHVVYPLSGFEGKLVRFRLWDDSVQDYKRFYDESTQEFVRDVEMINPAELIIVDESAGQQWYWIIIEEYDDASNAWVKINAKWISM